MDVYLFVVVIKINGKNEQVYDGNYDNPAIYTSSKKAWDYAKQMQDHNPNDEYQVIQKRVSFEIN